MADQKPVRMVDPRQGTQRNSLIIVIGSTGK